MWRFLLKFSHSFSKSITGGFADWVEVEWSSACFFAKILLSVSSIVLTVSLSDSLFPLPPPFWDSCSECLDSWVGLSWVSSLEFSLEFSSKLTLGVSSLIGSIYSRSNGTFNNLFFLYTWEALTSSGVISSDAIYITSENVPFCRKRSSKASSSWMNGFTFTIVMNSLAVPFGSYCLPGNVANFSDFIISTYFHACPKSCNLNTPHYNKNVGQMAFFCSLNPLLKPPFPVV